MKNELVITRLRADGQSIPVLYVSADAMRAPGIGNVISSVLMEIGNAEHTREILQMLNIKD